MLPIPGISVDVSTSKYSQPSTLVPAHMIPNMLESLCIHTTCVLANQQVRHVHRPFAARESFDCVVATYLLIQDVGLGNLDVSAWFYRRGSDYRGRYSANEVQHEIMML